MAKPLLVEFRRCEEGKAGTPARSVIAEYFVNEKPDLNYKVCVTGKGALTEPCA